MKKINVYLLVLVAVLISSSTVFAQKDIDTSKAGYTFEILKKIPATVVKDQYRTGTCWSFSGLSFFESELLRMKKDTFDLSEMYVVRMVYRDKAEKYVRYHGSHGFGGGGASHDVPYVIKKYGMLPESVYAGLNYGEKGHTHGELDNVTKGYCDAVMKNEKKLTEAWLGGFNGILDAYLGEIPEKFTYKGKEYTPQTYAKELGIVAEDYIKITSYSHHPFYEKFILEVPDNWANGEVYNVPLNELIEVIDYALNNGYSLVWGADVSEKGFSWKNGVAIVPDAELAPSQQGTERDRWEKLTQKEKENEMFSFTKPVKQKEITQQERQKGFDNWTTTDDHGMHIVGIAKDQLGTKYYIVKNSWNTDNVFKGYLYASDAYLKYKTMDIMLHKNGIPQAIKTKLGIK